MTPGPEDVPASRPPRRAPSADQDARSSFPLGRFFGIRVRAHASWLFIVALVTLSLQAQFSQTEPGWSGGRSWAAALITAALFFASVVTHELAHSLVAERFGIRVRSITLFLFGGVSQIESEARRPAEEFTIAIVGPLASFAIALACFAAHLAAGAGTFAGVVLFWLATTNVALGVFNLVPAFPLDGGRVLRGLVWWWTGDAALATRIAAGAGKAFAGFLIFLGLVRFFGGAGLAGLWMTFLGWFLLNAAGSGQRQFELTRALAGLKAQDLMATDYPVVPSDLDLERFVEEHLLRTGRRCFLVADGATGGDRVLGLLSARDIRSIPRERRAGMTVGEAMRPLDRLHRVEPGTDALRVLEIIGSEDLNQVPVMEGERLLGVVAREHFIRLLNTRIELGS